MDGNRTKIGQPAKVLYTMLNTKNRPKRKPKQREIGIKGIALLLGVSRSNIYHRIQNGKFSLEGIPVSVTTGGNWYDMRSVFQRVFPSANNSSISMMMYDFIQKNGRFVK